MEEPAAIEINTDTPEVYEYMLSLKGKLAFDIGANGGYLASKLAKQFTTVVAVEPCDESFWSLETRKEIIPIHMAISDHEGYVKLGIKGVTKSLGELFTGDSLTFWGSDQGTRDVPCTTLDVLASDYGYPDFIKIDTEGHEGYILEGGHKAFRHHPRFVIEIHDTKYGAKYMAYFREIKLPFRLVRHELYRKSSPNFEHHYWLVST